MAARSGLLRAAGGGALASAALWLSDLASLRTLQVAGVSNAEAQAQVLSLTAATVAALEVKLLLTHVAFGALLGLLLSWTFDAWPRFAPVRRRALAAAAFVLVMGGLAVAGMMSRYPQIYADRWWLAGGIRAFVQRLVTHTIGPVVFDALFVLLLAVVAGSALLRLVRLARERRSARLALGTAAALVALTIAARRLPLVRRAEAARPATPNVLILATDSMRADRLEDARVMPYSAALLKRGTLFRFAFTPIARTFPSWVSILTGAEPRQHGIRTMFPATRLRRDVGPTFVSALRDRGYRTFVVSDFAGDVFPRFPAGFDVVDAPGFTADALARSTVLANHTWALPFLRLAPLRDAFGEWRNLASVSDPEWLTDRVLGEIRRADRPFVGLAFFSTAHFPYAAPHPDYRRGAGDYRGRFLYHAPPVVTDETVTDVDRAQIRARYDGALAAIDRAVARLVASLPDGGRNTLLVVTADHGEELYEEEGIAGHGDRVDALAAQSVPLLIAGPGVPVDIRSDRQERLTDLGATLLRLLNVPSDEPAFAPELSLFATGTAPRPVCVETEIWFWPDRPAGLRGRRLSYPGIAELLELDPTNREIVLREDRVEEIEAAKQRGLVLGNRLYTEQLTPRGRETRLTPLAGVRPEHDEVDLAALFEQRCVRGDPRLTRVLDGLVYRDAP